MSGALLMRRVRHAGGQLWRWVCSFAIGRLMTFNASGRRLLRRGGGVSDFQ